MHIFVSICGRCLVIDGVAAVMYVYVCIRQPNELPYNLQAHFDLRQVAIACDGDDDRLSATYWLATPMGEDADDVSESVSVDFVEMSRKYCQVRNVVMNRLENTA